MKNKETMLKWLTLLGAVVAVSAAMISVGTAPGYATDDGEENEGWFNFIDYYAGGEDEIDEIRSGLLDDIEGAQTRIDTAISKLDDADIRDALVDAADRGVTVRVVADELYEDDEDFEVLVDHPDISVQFGDGELSYLPEPNISPLLEYCNQDDTDHDDHRTCTAARGGINANNESREMTRPAHYNAMSHTFFLIDDAQIWNISAPLTDEQPVWFAFRAISEELTNSFGREFRQMHGGVFSTTLSVYNGPLKSLTHQYPLRFTNRGQLRVRFNPQERLVKNVIDETYRARASVFVMTDNLTNEDLIDALKYKDENGFDVRVMVGPGQAETLEDDLAPLNPVEAPEDVDRLPSMVILDAQRDRNDRSQPTTVQLLSHELWRAQPFEVIVEADWGGDGSDRVRFYPSDTFADGVMWEILESGYGEENQNNPEIDAFVDVWEQMWTEANDG